MIDMNKHWGIMLALNASELTTGIYCMYKICFLYFPTQTPVHGLRGISHPGHTFFYAQLNFLSRYRHRAMWTEGQRSMDLKWKWPGNVRLSFSPQRANPSHHLHFSFQHNVKCKHTINRETGRTLPFRPQTKWVTHCSYSIHVLKKIEL